MAKKYADWVVIDTDTGEWRCNRCGAKRTPQQINGMLPLSVKGFCKMMEAFSDSHRLCQETPPLFQPQPRPDDAVLGGKRDETTTN